MDKNETLGKIDAIKHSFCLMLASCCFFLEPKYYDDLNDKIFIADSHGLRFIEVDPVSKEQPDWEKNFKENYPVNNLGIVIDQMKDPEIRQNRILNYLNLGVMMLIRETFELLKNYATKTGQFDKFKKCNGYHFCRLIRNAVTHDKALKIKDDEKKLLPIKFLGKEINIDMNRKPIPLNFLGYNDYINISNEMAKILKDELN